MASKKKDEERVLGPGAYGEVGQDVPDVEPYVLGEDGVTHPVSQVTNAGGSTKDEDKD